jgi:hypothetical protein
MACTMVGDTVVAIGAQIVRVDRELRGLFDRCGSGIGRAASDRIHAQIGALRTRRMDLAARLRVADMERSFDDALLRDRLERRQ